MVILEPTVIRAQTAAARRPACDMIDGVAAEHVLADKAYDADRLYRKIIDQGGDTVAPPSCFGSTKQIVPAT